MGNDVFANGREVSCKAADGKAIAAFPDVCFTPPTAPPTPPGVPIPYPNNGMASDCSGGSKTVLISGKEIMLKNKSYFSKSSGDEAGSAPKKGVVTSQNRGKVYFTSWSMDVKVEGENVVRHLDMTTHNHASQPPNTGPWPYLDSMAMAGQGPCAETVSKAKKACAKHANVKGRKAQVAAMCQDKKCAAARACVCSPYKPSNCCPGQTPHHIVPVHCFMPPGARSQGSSGPRYPGCENYKPNKAPCVCVTGQDKSTGDHKKCHKHFDALEEQAMNNGKAGSWSYSAASAAGAKSVAKAKKCDEACTKAQVDAGHQAAGISPNTPLRADPSGQNTPAGFEPSITRRGRKR